MEISRIAQAHGLDFISALNAGNKTRQKSFSHRSTDTVSISNEAMEKFLAMKKAGEGAKSATIASDVSAWYDTFRQCMGNVDEPDFSTWPPENLARREKLVAERDALASQRSNIEVTDSNKKLFGVLDQIMALDAVGDKQALSDSDMKAAVNALHSAMDRWEGDAPGTAAYDAGEGNAAPARPLSELRKSMFSIMLESLFLADLEESADKATKPANVEGEQTSGDGLSDGKDATVKSVTPLNDGEHAAAIKKILTDFITGKADLSDVPKAMSMRSDSVSSAVHKNHQNDNSVRHKERNDL